MSKGHADKYTYFSFYFYVPLAASPRYIASLTRTPATWLTIRFYSPPRLITLVSLLSLAFNYAKIFFFQNILSKLRPGWKFIGFKLSFIDYAMINFIEPLFMAPFHSMPYAYPKSYVTFQILLIFHTSHRSKMYKSVARITTFHRNHRRYQPAIINTIRWSLRHWSAVALFDYLCCCRFRDIL